MANQIAAKVFGPSGLNQASLPVGPQVSSTFHIPSIAGENYGHQRNFKEQIILYYCSKTFACVDHSSNNKHKNSSSLRDCRGWQKQLCTFHKCNDLKGSKQSTVSPEYLALKLIPGMNITNYDLMGFSTKLTLVRPRTNLGTNIFSMGQFCGMTRSRITQGKKL